MSVQRVARSETERHPVTFIFKDIICFSNEEVAEACYDTSSSISPEEETVQVFDFVLEDNIESGNNSYSFVLKKLCYCFAYPPAK